MARDDQEAPSALEIGQVLIRADRKVADSWVVHVSGELDASTAEVLVEVASELTSDGTALRISAAGLAFIDSAGLRAFLMIHDRARRHGAAVTIVDPSQATRRLLELVGLAEHFIEGRIPTVRS